MNAHQIDLSPSPRISRLRDLAVASLDKYPDRSESELAAYRSWIQSASEPSHIVRRGRLAGDILRHLTPYIGPEELIVGRFAQSLLSPDERTELERLRVHAPAWGVPLGQRAHMAIDYERVLRLGVRGTRRLIETYRSRLDLTRAEDMQRDDFYRACLEALDGVSALALAYARHAEDLAALEHDRTRMRELLEIAGICRRVPERPAETFREALQSIWFMTFAMCAGNQMLLFQLGRPDRLLWSYYRKDIEDGILTDHQARELIDCVSILLNNITPRGLAVGWMVGGRDANGDDASNWLSILFTETIGRVRLAYPGVGVCWHEGLDPALMELSCRLLEQGCTHPAIFNDEVITNGLLELGLPHRDACEYIHSTCVEITPIGISNVYVASPYHNLVQYLHDVLGVGPVHERTRRPVQMPRDKDELWRRLEERIADGVAAGVAAENRAMQTRLQYGGFPLLSCFVNDCLQRGLDIDHGGARANWLEPSFVGLANLTDAMKAIETLVYEQQRYTLDEVADALVNNFAGYERMLLEISHCPRYGNDLAEVDRLAQRIVSIIVSCCRRQRSLLGGVVTPGLFCWQMHEYLGRQTAASADGRLAGFPFADGSGPAQGRELTGPTAMVRSVTSWDHTPMIGGVAVNMRMAPPKRPGGLAPHLKALLLVFLQLGGFEAQVNVVSADTLREARRHPEQYRDLVVRVAGYSDYFVSLEPGMQDEIIQRTELEMVSRA